ncbi:hypothetical protein NDU88_003711 [Pleurodeles waltl]|uniref:Uncharacterized protein n=1 Tax=Pleurodeles waltl TaxID=8319 RepID=A0AAV7UZA1_PLEWA|nr:hypothetical protein NDU88_003711 [Pleurodeles waltl]
MQGEGSDQFPSQRSPQTPYVRLAVRTSKSGAEPRPKGRRRQRPPGEGASAVAKRTAARQGPRPRVAAGESKERIPTRSCNRYAPGLLLWSHRAFCGGGGASLRSLPVTAGTSTRGPCSPRR